MQTRQAGAPGAGHAATVYSIDHHTGSETHVSEGERSTYGAFLTNFTKAGVQATVVTLVTTSEKGAGPWQKGVGLLRIDASHEYEDAKHDFLSWKQHLLPVVMVVLHDCDKPGLAQVVWEYLNHCGDFTTIQSVDTIIVAAKDKRTHYWALGGCCGSH